MVTRSILNVKTLVYIESARHKYLAEIIKFMAMNNGTPAERKLSC